MIIILVVVAMNAFKPVETSDRRSYSDIWQAISDSNVEKVSLTDAEIVAHLKSGGKWTATYSHYDRDLIPLLREKGVRIEMVPQTSSFWLSMGGALIQILFLVAIWMFFMRQMQGGGKAMTFAKSRARLLSEEQKKVTFEDVAGIDEAKAELSEIVEFLREPKKFVRLGGRIPKGVLLMGSPGTGKTLLARAIAGEAGVPFFSISGSDFVEMFVGVGASRVRDMFLQGKKAAPCIMFIDEIDAVGRHRGAGLGGGHDEREQTLNQLLVEMDGFEPNDGLILIAATNRPDVLDPALLRPGRFDRQVVVPVPDVKGREQILKVHSRRVPMGKDVNLSVVARGTPGFSGADLENLINEAALLAARADKEKVEGADLEAARDKMMMGVERKSLMMSEDEKRTTAWHEAGHTLISVLLPGLDPLHKVSIIPRGRALGVTVSLPMEDKYTYSRDYFKARLVMMLGGRVAEEVALNQMTTGAGNDIERASDLARNMVCKWGMSDVLGPQAFGKKEEQIFLGREIAQHADFSESTAQLIDQEVSGLMLGAHKKATELITRHQDTLAALANRLLEKETIDAEEVMEVCAEAMKAEGIERPAKAEPEGAPETQQAEPTDRAQAGGDDAPDSPQETSGRKEKDTSDDRQPADDDERGADPGPDDDDE
ncbi:ATP-dependent zinc metalloprotease FtsH [Deltaproteobacteria bacterium OttesenSCG-928-K17]|nr:ATP-dependent zinc metalloprotease FtsH [Deltaproteobacteria bacterium OttesenSCG-928-K17]